jgi:hypothetical protein
MVKIRTIEGIVTQYLQGAIILSNAFDEIIEHCDPNGVSGLGNLKNSFLKHLDKKPKTDEEWSKWRTFTLGLVTGPNYVPPTQEELRSKERLHVERWRKALEQ